MHRSHHRWSLIWVGRGGRGKIMFVKFLVVMRRIILSRRGRLAVTVYIII